MYLLVAAKALTAWFFGYRIPMNIVKKKHKADGKIRSWPFWMFFILLWVIDWFLDIFLGYMALNLTTNDFIFGTGSTLNTFVVLLYYVFPIVGGFRRKKVCLESAE